MTSICKNERTHYNFNRIYLHCIYKRNLRRERDRREEIKSEIFFSVTGGKREKRNLFSDRII